MATQEKILSNKVREDLENGDYEGLETEECSSDDSDDDPSFDLLEETRSRLSKISLKKSRSRSKTMDEMGDEEGESVEDVEMPKLDAKDEKCFEVVEKMIKDGQLSKLKVDQCKLYLRKHGLRLAGNKDVLLGRIREHLEVLDGGGEKKYPISTFTMNCQGDACTGDIVMFEQKVYEMFSIASRSATGPPCGTRIVAGRIVKESYGAAKQQHTFTIEVLWSKGEKPLPPLHPLLIKGRNLYRLKTTRQRWVDEEERKKVLLEKHTRGSAARCFREIRIHEKERRMNQRKRRDECNKSDSIDNMLLQKKNNLPQQNPPIIREKPWSNNVLPQQTSNQPQPNQSITFEKQCNSNMLQKQINSQLQPQPLQSQSVVSGKLHVTAVSHDRISGFPYANNFNHLPATKPLVTQVHYCDFSRVPSTNKCNSSYPVVTLQHEQHNHASIAKPQEATHMFNEQQPLRDLNSHRNWSHKGSSSYTNAYYNQKPMRNLSSPPQSPRPVQRPQIHSAPGSPRPVQRQFCRYYRQGRCYYMENCKFLHE